VAIINDGDLNRLIAVQGEFNVEQLSEQWEAIVDINADQNGDHQIASYKQLYKTYGLLLADHTIIAGCLIIMTHQDAALCWEEVAEVIARGYQIDTDTQDGYINSIFKAKSRVSHLITKAESKRKELERRFGRRDKKEGNVSIYEAVGSLELAAGFSLDIDKLTLSHYNALKKGLRDREAAKKAAAPAPTTKPVPARVQKMGVEDGRD
jgi:hypothetical protein